jgi:hypothetical protein
LAEERTLLGPHRASAAKARYELGDRHGAAHLRQYGGKDGRAAVFLEATLESYNAGGARTDCRLTLEGEK